MAINFYEHPYDHSGRKWENKYDSIFNPGQKVSWPDFILECIFWWRRKLIKDCKDMQMGPGWTKPISGQVRRAIQQIHSLLRYFPHPDDEPLSVVAIKNYIRSNRVCSIGSYRKHRFKEVGGKKILNISEAEKDFIKGVQSELDKLIKQRNIFAAQASKQPKIEVKEISKIKFNKTNKTNSLDKFLDIEEELKETNGQSS